MIDKVVKDLQGVVPFKETTIEGDIVLVVADSLFYALVTGIERDTTRKDEWWHVSMRMLVIPPQQIVWTLREAQFTGKETFTMGGKPRFIKAVDFGAGKAPLPDEGKKKDEPSPAVKKGGLRVVK
ncbi:MAG: hypothetical protein ACOY3Z_05850 [Thermodesulfobacteriota bacterium]